MQKKSKFLRIRQNLHRLALALQITLLTSCATPSTQNSAHLIGATLWVQRSAEYDALCRQTYLSAKNRLLQITKDFGNKVGNKNPAKPLAVILDLDETVLDNSPYQAYLIKHNLDYPSGWAEWIDQADANPVPGARDFLRFARENKVAIFYISNRRHRFLESTLKNLKKLNLPIAKEQVLLRKSKSTIKTKRRDRVKLTHTVAFYIGDNLGDFTDAYDNTPHKARLDEVKKNHREFGVSYFILPNPMYGAWSAALEREDDNKTPHQLRLDSLVDF